MTHPMPAKYRRTSNTFNSRYPWTLFFMIRGLAGKKHNAIDYPCPPGTPVVSPVRGFQIFAGYKYGYGKTIILRTMDGEYKLWFTHLSVIPIKRVGKMWKEGETFCWSGNTGISTGPHVHFAVKDKQDRWVDPQWWMKNYRDPSVVSTPMIKALFRTIWGREPATGEWKVFIARVKLGEIKNRSDLISKLKYWNGVVYPGGKYSELGDKKWQRHKEKYL